MSELPFSISEIWQQGGWIAWTFSIASSFLLALMVKGSLKTLASRLRKSQTPQLWNAFVIQILNDLKAFVLFFWLLSLCIRIFNEDVGILHFFKTVVTIVTLYQIWIWGYHGLSLWRKNVLLRKASEDLSSSAALGLVYAAIQCLFIVTLFLIGLSNMGVDIAALLAGLGVGGIAVALAAQNILGDLLASLSIVLDKPFVVGDTIIVGNDQGTVENIGIKTTRVRSISGEELIFSNKDLLESRVRNTKRMWERRGVQTLGVVYSTPTSKLEKIPQWMSEVISRYSEVRFERCHLLRYGGSSLDYELVFWVSHADYNVFMDFQQKVLLDILKKFESESVEFAFPTQTLYIQK